MSLIILLVFLSIAPVYGQDAPGEVEVQPVQLADLVAKADLVALVRVLDTDYQFLQVLVPYKVSRPLEDILEVYEEGLHEGECYFENPTVLEEGRRHLVFLKFSKDVAGQYNGLEAGCRLDVLVSEQNLYALRYPLSGISLADDFSAHAQPMVFRDAYALVADEDITPDQRERLLAAGQLEAVDGNFRYTHGIDLGQFRRLMGPEALTLDRGARQNPNNN